MEIANIDEARSRLSLLVEQALRGEEVVIASEGRPLVRLVPIQPDASPRVGGQWKGQVRMAEDFDSLPDDLADAFGIPPGCGYSSTPMSSSGGWTIPTSSPTPRGRRSRTARPLFTSARPSFGR